MNPSSLGKVAAVGLAVTGAAWALARRLRSRQKALDEIEQARRLDIHRRGRITSGQIVDLIEPQDRENERKLVVYKYDIAGVAYEVAQDLARLPAIYDLAQRMAGRTISLKYDPKRPSNSIIACEEWSGISAPHGFAAPSSTSSRPPSHALKKH
jgi:hypothetical protein